MCMNVFYVYPKNKLSSTPQSHSITKHKKKIFKKNSS